MVLVSRLGAATAAVALGFLDVASAECANACSGHGTCGGHDMCTCYANYQGNDCSERTCYFALAHVDTPKGDLNGDGIVSGPLTTVITGSEVYPWGTTEQYPNAHAHEGHFYSECANKGLCDRMTGVCNCFDGYTGTACARMACPNECSGHGTCETIKELAEMADFDSQMSDTPTTRVAGSANHHSYDAKIEESYAYSLWDSDKTMACKCDPAFFGADCSRKKCAYGVDPLYYDVADGVIYQTTVVHLGSSGPNRAGMSGTFKIVFYDVFGEKYVTRDIDANPRTATAAKVSSALQALPNSVIWPNALNGDVTAEASAAVYVSKQDPAGTLGTIAGIGAGAEGSFGAGLGTQGTVPTNADTTGATKIDQTTGATKGQITPDAVHGFVGTTAAPSAVTVSVNTGSLPTASPTLSAATTYYAVAVSTTVFTLHTASPATAANTVTFSGDLGAGQVLSTKVTKLAHGVEFTIQFNNNPGILRSIEADTQLVNNPGAAEYWVSNARQGQFAARYSVNLGRVNTLMHGSNKLYTNSDYSATNAAPVGTLVKVGGQEFRVAGATSAYLTLSEVNLGATILPVLTETGAVASAFTKDKTPHRLTVSGASTQVIAVALRAGSRLYGNSCPFVAAQGAMNTQATVTGPTSIDQTTGATKGQITIASNHGFSGTLLLPTSVTVQGTLPTNSATLVAYTTVYYAVSVSATVFTLHTASPATTGNIVTFSGDLTAGQTFTTISSAEPIWDIAIGGTTLFVATDNDCHTDSWSNQKIYRRNDDPAAQNLYKTSGDTGVVTTKAIIAQRGSPNVYLAEPVVDNTSPTALTQYVKAYASTGTKFTFETASKGAVMTASTPIFVNSLGPMVASAVADGDSDVAATDAGNFFSDSFSTAGTQFPIFKGATGSDASLVAGSVLLLGGRRYKVRSRASGTAALVVLGDNYAGGELQLVCSACISGIAAAGTSITSAKKVTLAKGDRIVVGSHLSEDLLSTVTAAVDDGTTIATSPGTFRGHIANSADGAVADVSYSGSPKDLYLVSNNEQTLGTIVTEQADAVTFQYVAQCSNRGWCNEETGLCECFSGFVSANCDTQNALAL
jgi:hypothetical protein